MIARTAFVLLAVWPSLAMAELVAEVEDQLSDPPALSQIAVPCLREKEERRYVVTWWIEDRKTGERRDPRSQEVRRRC